MSTNFIEDFFIWQYNKLDVDLATLVEDIIYKDVFG